MDDFLGTSIQFSEQQIKRLEAEHADQESQTTNELLTSGWLDTDYETSDSETHSETSSVDQSEETVLSSKDGEQLKGGEIRKQSLAVTQQFDVVTQQGILRFMEIIFADVKYLMVLFIVMFAMPQAMMPTPEPSLTGVLSRASCYEQHYGSDHQFWRQTSIQWSMELFEKREFLPRAEEEKPEGEEKAGSTTPEEELEHEEGRRPLLNVNILQTTTCRRTSQVYSARLYQWEYRLPAATKGWLSSSYRHGGAGRTKQRFESGNLVRYASGGGSEVVLMLQTGKSPQRITALIAAFLGLTTLALHYPAMEQVMAALALQ